MQTNCKNEIIKLGNKVHVTDPCYGPSVWCAGDITNVKEGDYYVIVDVNKTDWGLRVHSLTVLNVDSMLHSKEEGISKFDEKLDFEVGVDSGQAGIFDYDYYKSKCINEDEVNDEWYDAVCSLTLSKKQFGTLSGKAVVSSSGYGDGGYDCFVCRNNKNQVVGIMIKFIEQDDSSDEAELDPEVAEYYTNL